MAANATPLGILFPDPFCRPVVPQFDQPHATSDAGTVLVKAAGEQLGLTQLVAERIYDTRRSGSVLASAVPANGSMAGSKISLAGARCEYAEGPK